MFHNLDELLDPEKLASSTSKLEGIVCLFDLIL